MPNQLYHHSDDMPGQIPVFPLTGAILLPRSHLPLNIFEPRYLSMINDAISGNRIIGMIQPIRKMDDNYGSSQDNKPQLQKIGGAGRIISFNETDDQHLTITLVGISRFQIKEEISSDKLYRICDVDFSRFEIDFNPDHGEKNVNRARFLDTFRKYLDVHHLEADWKAIEQSPTENLVNTLSMISPYGLQEKQALLEAETLEERSEILIALTEMSLAEDPEAENQLQ